MKKGFIAIFLTIALLMTGCSSASQDSSSESETTVKETTTVATKKVTTSATEASTEMDSADILWYAATDSIKKQFKDEIDNGYNTFGTHNGKEYVAFKYNLNNATDASFDMDLEMGSYTANLALFTTLFGSSPSASNQFKLMNSTLTYDTQIYSNDDFGVGWQYSDITGFLGTYMMAKDMD